MNTKRVVYIATIAALYAVFTVAIAPLSYGPVQFRISEALKIFVLFDPYLALGIGIGTFFANLASPFVGPWELVFMPLTDMAGGLLAYWIYRATRKRYLSMGIYAVTTGAAVAIMLTMMGADVFTASFVYVTASELVILCGAIPLLWGALSLQKRLTTLGRH